jgi:hypothetical protein
MHLRVVRFTDVDPERVERLVNELEGHAGPPEGIKSTGLQMMVDPDQRTAVVIQMFASADDLASSEQTLDAMDPAETPGTRASVDRGEVKLDLSLASQA